MAIIRIVALPVLSNQKLPIVFLCTKLDSLIPYLPTAQMLVQNYLVAICLQLIYINLHDVIFVSFLGGG